MRLDRPPPDEAYLSLPADFGRRFALFIDTEEEFDWSRPHSRDARSTRAVAAIPEMQERLRSHGVAPVYLVDHPIATDPAAIAILAPIQESGECEIGTQLHPWVSPPFEEELNLRNSFAGNLPAALERAKIARLTEAVEAGFGRRPRIYRAGRYGVGPHTGDILESLGYAADASVRPLFDYRGEGGPDFSSARPRPFRAGALVEIPLCAALTGPLGRAGAGLYRAIDRRPLLRSLAARTHLLSRVSLTPEGMPAAEVADAVRRLSAQGVRLFTFSFHSPSLEPGHTPYVRTAADLARFHLWWEEIFGFLEGEGIRPASLEEILAATARAAASNPGPASLSPGASTDKGPVAQR
ncbi:MAG: polysaccharide deacetylase family protein [Alphaproteobacteria bacterium]|nr:polysaccharide deacetylase family protein [Alphaproteobacteria bacterium]MBV9372496.1 polysaccharide deacetylase family protein [Alphaproteobacteria bacterium]MBV9902171.1 polysaccharide deacetylase family protein [Alphaproteobacteria bacterium]